MGNYKLIGVWNMPHDFMKTSNRKMTQERLSQGALSWDLKGEQELPGDER